MFNIMMMIRSIAGFIGRQVRYRALYAQRSHALFMLESAYPRRSS